MSSTPQKVAMGEELRTAISLLVCGLRELKRLDGANDFYHLPLLLLASGFERLMKTIICCHYHANNGKFPDRYIFTKDKKGHDLVHLLKMITCECYSETYLTRVPAARADIEFLRSDSKLRKVVEILSEFGQGARYYNLNVVLGEPDQGPSPEDEWQKLKIVILQEHPNWERMIADPTQSSAMYQHINTGLTVPCERFARALSRLFTIGGLGELARCISPYTRHFSGLMDEHLGKTNYETIMT